MKAFLGFGLILISITVLQSYKTQLSDNHDGELSGVFSVSPTRKVKFSQGNLQYCPATETWRFADYQWETIGEANITHGTDSNYNGWLDMFTFLSSGWFDGENINYKPTSRNNSVVKTTPNGKKYNYMGYGPSCDSENPDDMRYDWGMYNPIINGGNKSGLWRTMTDAEFFYLLFEREVTPTEYSKQCKLKTKRKNAKPVEYYNGFATLLINGCKIYGVVILPDYWNGAKNSGNFKSLGDAKDLCSEGIIKQHYSDNIYTYQSWLEMEKNGALFLPVVYCLNKYVVCYSLFQDYNWELAKEITNDYRRCVTNGGQTLNDGLISKSTPIPVRLIKDIN